MKNIEATVEVRPFPRREWFWCRVDVSVFFGLLTVALCVLWVRSYWVNHYVEARYYRHQVFISTFPGILGVSLDTNQTSSGPGNLPMTYWKYAEFLPGPRDYGLVTKGLRVISFKGFRYVNSASIHEADLPFRMLIIPIAAAPLVLWIHLARRFSLRTLLLATTLLAAVLGFSVWATR